MYRVNTEQDNESNSVEEGSMDYFYHLGTTSEWPGKIPWGLSGEHTGH